MRLLIDADILIFKAAVCSQKEIDWDDTGEDVSVTTNKGLAISILNMVVHRLLETLGTKDYTMCISHELNFRRSVLPTYKHNRAKTRSPLLRGFLVSYCKDNHPWKDKPRLEADDVLGILGTLPSKERKVICTIDKDLMQIPGYHYNWNKKSKGIFQVSEREAEYQFYLQILMGDSTDGYTGCPGIGSKSAEAILGKTDKEDWWDTIVQTFEKPSRYNPDGLTEDDAIQQARVAKILQASDYDLENNEVILWKPNKENEDD